MVAIQPPDTKNKLVINFTVPGSIAMQKIGTRDCLLRHDPRGNPQGKLRLTQNQYWKPEVKRYFAYKDLVRKYFYEAVKDREQELRQYARVQVAGNELQALRYGSDKPIVPVKKQKMRLDIHILWASGVHSDPESVYGAIADALFKDDKWVVGSFDYDYAQDGSGGVMITLVI